MDSHPSHSTLLPHITKYPHLAGCVFQVYNDILHAQRWEDLETLALPTCGRIVLKGTRPETKTVHIIMPCNLTESLSLNWLSSVFGELVETSEIYLAIVSDDSSIVYYRVSKGIVKPPS
ncbi:tRNA intron endonuclease [Gautieria morchelliformis]|nr:tRNA intron endonuclease [Gautieria morchelliformis]